MDAADIRRVLEAGAPAGLTIRTAGEDSWRAECPLLGLVAGGMSVRDALLALHGQCERGGDELLRALPKPLREAFLAALRALARPAEQAAPIVPSPF